jgi:DNA-binding MarR family transcriptional regulator
MKREEPVPEKADTKRGDLGVVDALAQLSFAVQGALSRIAATHELSMIQVRLLGVLRDRSVGMNELALHLDLDKSSVTGLIDRAERRGLVRRKTSTTDRRAVEVSITPAGRKLAERGAGEFAERVAALVAPLTAAERATLSGLATRILVGRVLSPPSGPATDDPATPRRR